MFGTMEAKQIEEDIKSINRKLTGTITQLPKINWNQEIENINLNPDLEQEVKDKLTTYLKRMENNLNSNKNNINDNN